MHPLTTKETFRDFRLEAHTIPYAIVIPNIVTGHFIISALLNVDWCKDDDVTSQDFIHNGDYHNEETHDFVISEGMTDILKDIKLEEYNDVVTCKCLVSSFICWKCFLVLTFLFCYVLLFCIFSIKFFTYIYYQKACPLQLCLLYKPIYHIWNGVTLLFVDLHSH